MKFFCISDFHGALDVLPALVKKIKDVNPDVIIFTGDVVKGYARGDEWLAAKAKGRPGNKELPAIKEGFAEGNIICMLTGKEEPGEKMEKLKEYVLDYIKKPFNKDDLLNIVKDYLAYLG